MKQPQIKYSKIIPIKGFYAMAFFGKIYIRDEYKTRGISIKTLNHEGIHICQKEDFSKRGYGGIAFYLCYVLEGLLKLIPCLLTGKNTYRSISFEQEAYKNQSNYKYQSKRKRGSGTQYIFKLGSTSN